VANPTSPLKHVERQPPDETGSVDRDSDVCQREKENHDVIREDVVCPDCAVAHFCSTNSSDGKQEEICY